MLLITASQATGYAPPTILLEPITKPPLIYGRNPDNIPLGSRVRSELAQLFVGAAINHEGVVGIRIMLFQL
ncbi:hypothetical protein, partial [Rhizobium leguminosarum]|uniref:hypothetical protein n=1 Tax=Rhizobium leguminosarum TaxID=384 RepID=UPI001FDA0184